MTIAEIDTLVATLRRLGVKRYKAADVELDLTDEAPATPEQIKEQQELAKKMARECSVDDLDEEDIMYWSVSMRPTSPPKRVPDPD
jgi:hypothetical protein